MLQRYCFFHSNEIIRQNRDLQSLSDLLGEQFGLIIPSLVFSGRMQRNGDQPIRMDPPDIVSQVVCRLTAEKCGILLSVAVFESIEACRCAAIFIE